MTEGLTIEQRAARIEKYLLKTKPLTGGELAERAGFPSGQSISRALGVLKDIGHIVVLPGRRPSYLKPNFSA